MPNMRMVMNTINPSDVSMRDCPRAARERMSVPSSAPTATAIARLLQLPQRPAVLGETRRLQVRRGPVIRGALRTHQRGAPEGVEEVGRLTPASALPRRARPVVVDDARRQRDLVALHALTPRGTRAPQRNREVELRGVLRGEAEAEEEVPRVRVPPPRIAA